MFEVEEDEFVRIVEKALDSIPKRFSNDLDNVVFVVEKEPSFTARSSDGRYRETLGLYSGTSLPKRSDGYGFANIPDKITVFRGPHQRIASSKEELEENVRRTVVHEIGHYFGMDEDQLREMGYGST